MDTEFATLPPEVLAHRPRCPGCTPETALAEGARPCSFYDCPGLPDSLKVTCDTCMYDFYAGDGQVKCDHATCETAQRLRANVVMYETWRRYIAATS